MTGTLGSLCHCGPCRHAPYGMHTVQIKLQQQPASAVSKFQGSHVMSMPDKPLRMPERGLSGKHKAVWSSTWISVCSANPGWQPDPQGCPSSPEQRRSTMCSSCCKARVTCTQQSTACSACCCFDSPTGRLKNVRRKQPLCGHSAFNMLTKFVRHECGRQYRLGRCKLHCSTTTLSWRPQATVQRSIVLLSVPLLGLFGNLTTPVLSVIVSFQAPS
jgi:hypothetical protein